MSGYYSTAIQSFTLFVPVPVKSLRVCLCARVHVCPMQIKYFFYLQKQITFRMNLIYLLICRIFYQKKLAHP